MLLSSLCCYYYIFQERIVDLRNFFSSNLYVRYSYNGIQSILDEIDIIASSKNYEFLDVVVSEDVVENRRHYCAEGSVSVKLPNIV